MQSDIYVREIGCREADHLGGKVCDAVLGLNCMIKEQVE